MNIQGQGIHAFRCGWIHPKVEKSYLASEEAQALILGNSASLKVMRCKICEFPQINRAYQGQATHACCCGKFKLWFQKIALA